MNDDRSAIAVARPEEDSIPCRSHMGLKGLEMSHWSFIMIPQPEAENAGYKGLFQVISRHDDITPLQKIRESGLFQCHRRTDNPMNGSTVNLLQLAWLMNSIPTQPAVSQACWPLMSYSQTSLQSHLQHPGNFAGAIVMSLACLGKSPCWG